LTLAGADLNDVRFFFGVWLGRGALGGLYAGLSILESDSLAFEDREHPDGHVLGKVRRTAI
jgi:hypothetical protein